MEEKRRPNIILYTLLMIVVFFAITELFIWGYGASFILDAITNYPQGDLVISEAVLSALVLIVMLKFGNFYVFSQPKEKFTKGLFLGTYYLIGSVIFFIIYGVLYGGIFEGKTVVNLLIGCLFVGIAEELLCRGWLLNEFLERYGDSKAGVWYSIIVSGLIFGLMHIGNIFTTGQSVSDTIVQVLNAAVTGIMYGIIYYKTKNIWSVIFLHAFWDFSLFIAEAVPVTEATVRISQVSASSLLSSALMVAALLINVIPYIRDIDEEPNKKLVVICAVLSFIGFMFFTVYGSDSEAEYGKTYEYPLITIDHFAVTKDNCNTYYMEESGEGYSYAAALYYDGENLKLRNMNTDYEINLDYESLYDYRITENDEFFVLAYIDMDDSSNPFLRYCFVDRNALSDKNGYIDDIKNNMKEYLLPDVGEIVVISPQEDSTNYITVYNSDLGYYILLNEEELALIYNG